MQFSTQAARRADEPGDVRSLHLSLNAPVIAIDELPVGPARAGVVLCALPEGGRHLEIAIRSLRTGEVIAVATPLDFADSGDERAAVEAALSYAEGMGFLFDEDEVVAGGESGADKVRALWRDLVEDAPERSRTSEGVAATAEPEDPAFEDVAAELREVPVCDSGSEARAIEVEQVAASEPPVETLALPAPETLLSKFRLVLDGARSEPPALDPSTAACEPLPDSRIRLLSRY